VAKRGSEKGGSRTWSKSIFFGAGFVITLREWSPTFVVLEAPTAKWRVMDPLVKSLGKLTARLILQLGMSIVKIHCHSFKVIEGSKEPHQHINR
jgi:hypothetical protein